jgi:hypothetical protein
MGGALRAKLDDPKKPLGYFEGGTRDDGKTVLSFSHISLHLQEGLALIASFSAID